MKIQFIIQGKFQKLLLIFTGWASDKRIFSISPDIKKDICICSDYRNLEWDETLFNNYTEIQVIAWSLGVFTANILLQDSSLPIKKAIAINGTLYPADDAKGIPISIYHGTKENLTQDNLLKFYRRMCGSGTAYKEFLKFQLFFFINDLKEELKTIETKQQETVIKKIIYDKVIIGTQDNIFPPENQENSWKGFSNIEKKEIAHYNETMWNELIEKDYSL